MVKILLSTSSLYTKIIPSYHTINRSSYTVSITSKSKEQIVSPDFLHHCRDSYHGHLNKSEMLFYLSTVCTISFF